MSGAVCERCHGNDLIGPKAYYDVDMDSSHMRQLGPKRSFERDWKEIRQRLERKIAAPLMMPSSAKYRDLGTMIEGKIEAGILDKSKSYLLMPNKETVSVAALYGEQEEELEGGKAFAGDQVRLRIRGVEEEDILPGFVLCSTKRPVNYVSSFQAQVHILPELKSILSRLHTLVIGPGLGRQDYMQSQAKLAVRLAREHDMYLVIDADGLWMIQQDPDIIRGYTKAILTPNVVEFKRLCESQVL